MLFYCPNCRREIEAEPTSTVTTKSGRIAYKSNCPTCGLDLAEFTPPSTPPSPAPQQATKVEEVLTDPSTPPEAPPSTTSTTEANKDTTTSEPTITAEDSIKAYMETVASDDQTPTSNKPEAQTQQQTTPEAQLKQSTNNTPSNVELNETQATPAITPEIEEFPIESSG